MTKNNNKILIATGIFPPDIGGPATMLEALSKELASAGFKVRILTYSDIKEKNKNNDFHIYRINRKSPLRYLKYLFCFFRLALSSNLIFVTDTYSVGYFAYLAKILLHKKYILRFTGDSAWEYAANLGIVNEPLNEFVKSKHDHKIEKMKAKRRKILLNADKIITVSRSMRQIAIDIGAKSENVEVVYSSVDFLVQLEKNIKPSGVLKVITIGRLVKLKGIEKIIEVINEYVKLHKNVKLKFLIVGSGPRENELKKIVGKLGLNDVVEFTGRKNRQETLGLLNSSDIFILNSIYEAFSHTILEAMKYNIPVMVSRVGGNREMIDHGINGFMFETDNSIEMLKYLHELVIDPKLRAGLANKAKESLNRYSWEKNIKETIRIINNEL